jgi:cobalamin biosynthetic protein CobC
MVDGSPTLGRDIEGRARPAVEAAIHGGRLAAAMSAYPDARRPWMDLSTGINPEPWAGPRAPVELLARLPDPTHIAELEAAAARAFGVMDASRVVAVAGAEAGLRLLPQALPIEDVAIVSPTYSGHEAAWRGRAGTVVGIAGDQVDTSAASLLVIVNPNNPDGRAVDREALGDLVSMRSARGFWTVVDESFVETRSELSVAGLASDRLIVLRSFGKFYGLPGLRLGFVIASPDVAGRLRTLQGEWPVGAEAIWMGAAAYGDTAWRVRTCAKLRDRSEALNDLLGRHGLEVVGGTSLFSLVSVADAQSVFERLCRAGVLTRPFAYRADWLRLGLPRDEDFGRLDDALRAAVGGGC